jgi:hypothetical protein
MDLMFMYNRKKAGLQILFCRESKYKVYGRFLACSEKRKFSYPHALGGRRISENLCLSVSKNDCNERNLILVNIFLPYHVPDSISRVIGDGAIEDASHRVKIQISCIQLPAFKQERKNKRTERDKHGLINYETMSL